MKTVFAFLANVGSNPTPSALGKQGGDLKIHEYQAKALLTQYGIPVPGGRVASTAAEAREMAAEIGCKVVIKAQVYAGGRGKAGGIKTVNNPEEARRAASQLIGAKLVTHQTGPEGKIVKKVLVEQGLNIAKELYLGIIPVITYI